MEKLKLRWVNLQKATGHVRTTLWIARNYSKSTLFICLYAFFRSGFKDFFQLSYLIKYRFLQLSKFQCNLHSISLHNFFGSLSNLQRFSCCYIFYKLQNSWRIIFWFSPNEKIYMTTAGTYCIKLKTAPFTNFKEYMFQIVDDIIVYNKFFTILHTKNDVISKFIGSIVCVK